MRHLQDNNKALEQLINRLHDAIKPTLKFSKQLLSETELIQLCHKHLALLTSLQDNKENLHPNTNSPIVQQEKTER